MDLDYINDLVDIDKYYLYFKKEPILSANTMKELKKKIKKEIDKPNKEIKVHVIEFNKTCTSNRLFMIACNQQTITPSLSLLTRDDDNGHTITYSKEELKKRKFKVSDIKKIIKAIQKQTISFSKATVSISDILKKTE
jgi:hypothetical protein